MFEDSLPGMASLADAEDATVIDAITGWACAEATAAGAPVAHDPAAVLAHRSAVRSRDVQVGT